MNSFVNQMFGHFTCPIPRIVVSPLLFVFFVGFQALQAGPVLPLCLTPPTSTATKTSTRTPSNTATATWTFSATPTSTWTTTFTWTPTPTPTFTATSTSSPTLIGTTTPTQTPLPTFAPTETPTLTATIPVFSSWPDDFYFSKPYPNPNHEVEGVHFDYRLPPNVLRLWLTVYTINGDPIFKEMFLGPAPGSYTYVLNWSRVSERWANGMYFFVWRAQHNGAEQRFIFKVMILR